jgi:ABC-2 type transport system permease protein
MQTISHSLHNLWVIFRHEFRLFFVSPLFYVLGAIWLGFAGFFYSIAWFAGGLNEGFSEPSMSITFFPMAFLTMFFAPAFTMRLVSEEFHSGTQELLLTSPIREWEIVVGKWLAAWATVTVLILMTLISAAVLFWRGSPDSGKMIAEYLGFWLWSGAALAIGVFASSLTQYQLIALLIGEGIALVLFLADRFSTLPFLASSFIGPVFTEAALTSHLQYGAFTGIIEAKSWVYFFGIISISLFLATQVVGSRRWRA